MIDKLVDQVMEVVEDVALVDLTYREATAARKLILAAIERLRAELNVHCEWSANRVG